MRTKSLVGIVVCLALALGSVALAADRPHHGKIISIDKVLMTMTVQSENNDDQWTLYWTESSKLKGDLTVAELKVGDEIHFDFTLKDNKMWLTELKRTEKAKG